MYIDKFVLLIFVLLLSINLYAFNIDNIDTKIIVKDNGSLQISDTVLIKNVVDSEKLIFKMVPIYDLVIKSDIKDLNYSYSFNSLSVTLPECCIVDNSVSFEVIYLTDAYSLKNESVLTINYFPILTKDTNAFNLFFPKNTELIDLSVDFKNVSIIDNKFVVSLTNVSNFDSNYSINYKMTDNLNTNNKVINLVYFILGIFIFCFYNVLFLSN